MGQPGLMAAIVGCSLIRMGLCEKIENVLPKWNATLKCRSVTTINSRPSFPNIR